jgi:hypothetical protein
MIVKGVYGSSYLATVLGRDSGFRRLGYPLRKYSQYFAVGLELICVSDLFQ